MNILESTSKLLEWFQKKDYFNIKDNMKDVVEDVDKNRDVGAIILGLEELVLNNIIKKITISKVDIYILNRPINSLNQTLTISGDTSLVIASIIQKIADSLKRTDILVDPLHIMEKDIVNLITILSELIAAKNNK